MKLQRQVRTARAHRGTPLLVEENMRKVVLPLRRNVLAAAVRAAFGVYVVPLSIEQFYNDKGVLKAERASLA